MEAKQVRLIPTQPAILVTIAQQTLNHLHLLAPTPIPKKVVQALVKMLVQRVVPRMEQLIIRVAAPPSVWVDSLVVAELVEHLRDVQLLQVIM